MSVRKPLNWSSFVSRVVGVAAVVHSAAALHITRVLAVTAALVAVVAAPALAQNYYSAWAGPGWYQVAGQPTPPNARILLRGPYADNQACQYNLQPDDDLADYRCLQFNRRPDANCLTAWNGSCALDRPTE